MKICGCCNKEKEDSEFNKRRFSSGNIGLQAYCKGCNRRYHKTHYSQHKSDYKAKNLQRKQTLRNQLRELKKLPCGDCKHKFHFAAMDFDHRDGTDKVGNVSRLVTEVSWETLQKELDKCDLVCSNCHRIRTYERQHDPVV